MRGTTSVYLVLALLLASTALTQVDQPQSGTSIVLLQKLGDSNPLIREFAFQKLREQELTKEDYNFIRQKFATFDQDNPPGRNLRPETRTQLEYITALLVEPRFPTKPRFSTPTEESTTFSPAILTLSFALTISHPDIRQQALDTLAHYDELSLTFQLLNNTDVNIRRNIAYALGELRFDAEESVLALVESMKDPDPMVQSEAIQALAKMRIRLSQQDLVFNQLDSLYSQLQFNLPSHYQQQLVEGNGFPIFTLSDKYRTDLDSVLATEITPALRDRFQAAGFPLSRQSVIRIKKKGQQWAITDSDRQQIFKISADSNGRLQVVRESIALTLIHEFEKKGLRRLSSAAKISPLPTINPVINQTQAKSWLLANPESNETQSYILRLTPDPNPQIKVSRNHPNWEIRRQIVRAMAKLGQQSDSTDQIKRRVLSFLINKLTDPNDAVCQAVAKSMKSFTRPDVLSPPTQASTPLMAGLPYNFNNPAAEILSRYLNLSADPNMSTQHANRLQSFAVMALGEIGHPAYKYLPEVEALLKQKPQLIPVVATTIGKIIDNEYQAFTFPTEKKLPLPDNFNWSTAPLELTKTLKDITRAGLELPLDAVIKVKRPGRIWAVVDSQGRAFYQIRSHSDEVSSADRSYEVFQQTTFHQDLKRLELTKDLRKVFSDANLPSPGNVYLQQTDSSWTVFEANIADQPFCMIRPITTRSSTLTPSPRLAAYFRITDRRKKDDSLDPPISDADIESVVSNLSEHLTDGSFIIRRSILASLGQIGPPAKLALPDVVKQLDHTDATVRRNAIISIEKIMDRELLPEDIIRQLALTVQKDEPNQHLAIRILAGQKSNAKLAKLALRQALNQGNVKTRQVILTAFSQIDPRGTAETLRQYLRNDSQAEVRSAAAKSLQKTIGSLRTKHSDFVRGLVTELVLSMADPSPEVQAAAIQALSSIVIDDIKTKNTPNLALDILKSALYSGHQRQNGEYDFKIVPIEPTEDGRRDMMKLRSLFVSLERDVEKPTAINQIRLNATRILAEASLRDTETRKQLYPALFTFSRHQDFLKLVEENVDPLTETVTLLQRLDRRDTLQFLTNVIDGKDLSFARPINTGDRQHALLMLGEIIDPHRYDAAGLSTWKFVLPILIQSMLDKEDILVRSMSKRVWDSVISTKPDLTVPVLFERTLEQRNDLITRYRVALEKAEENVLNAVTKLLEQKKTSTLLDQYEMSIRLLEQFGSYTPIFLLETLDDSNKTKEHRLHALRFLVFYEELFLGKKQPLDSPSDKLASVLNRNLSDPEVKEAYKKALDYIPQR